MIFLNQQEVKLRIDELVDKLNYYSERYYMDDNPEIKIMNMICFKMSLKD